MLVLDEPTAHLDTVTARAVATDLLAGGSERTVIWITHDGLGLDSMDRVIDLGEHRDLLRESVQLAVP